MVEEHGSDMSARDKRGARRVNAEFEFEQVGIGRPGPRNRTYRERDHEPPPQAPRENLPQPQLFPSPARPPGPGRRREGFGAYLTSQDTPSTSNAVQRSRSSSPPAATDTDREAIFFSRLQAMVPNSPNAITVVKAAVRGYRISESSSKDLISTVWNLSDQNLDQTANIINALVDHLEQEDKKQDLLASWKGFMIEQRLEFPELTAVKSNSAYAAVTSGRVINVKHATATRSRRGSSKQVWDRVAKAAASSSKRPNPKNVMNRHPISSPVSFQQTSAFRQTQRKTPWSNSNSLNGASGSSLTLPTLNQSVTVIHDDPRSSKQGSGRSAPQKLPRLSHAQFPELPSLSTGKQKPPMSGNVSLKNISGGVNQPTTAWGPAANGMKDSLESGNTTHNVEGSEKGKKAKGKQKQTLFTLGSHAA